MEGMLADRYEVIKVLGAGGFGQTYLAEDTHMPSRRKCVIKQLKPLVNNPYNHKNTVRRFEREAAILERLGRNSDKIPELYAYFCADGEFYLVQEWIEGLTLRQVVETRGCLLEKAVRELLLSLLAVLSYVHGEGIIHRDVKPENIILRKGDGKPVLIDFGAVKETVRTVETDGSSSMAGQSMVIGTPGYMASEQALGRPVYASDIYSLGLTAIYLLTGKNPWELSADSHSGCVIWQDSALSVSAELKVILHQAISPLVGDRYSTAAKMLYALTTEKPESQAKSISSGSTIHLTSQTPERSPIKTSQPRRTNRTNTDIPWVVGGLMLGGLFTTIAIAAISRLNPQVTTEISGHESNVLSSPKVSEGGKEVVRQTINTPTAPSPSPEVNDSPPVVRRVDNPPAPQLEPQLGTEAVRVAPEVSTDSPQPEAGEARVGGNENLNAPASNPVTPEPTENRQPENNNSDQSPSDSVAPPQESNNAEASPVKNYNVNYNVPVFTTGTPKDAVKKVLGEPVKSSNGLYNTHAFLYQPDPNFDIGYLFDRETQKIRQTEISFSQSVNPEVMKKTLNKMVNGNANSDIKRGLEEVALGNRQRYSFNIGGLEGIIERNQQQRIYIGVWEADLH